jgi:hypothetical protein
MSQNESERYLIFHEPQPDDDFPHRLFAALSTRYMSEWIMIALDDPNGNPPYRYHLHKSRYINSRELLNHSAVLQQFYSMCPETIFDHSSMMIITSQTDLMVAKMFFQNWRDK